MKDRVVSLRKLFREAEIDRIRENGHQRSKIIETIPSKRKERRKTREELSKYIGKIGYIED